MARAMASQEALTHPSLCVGLCISDYRCFLSFILVLILLNNLIWMVGCCSLQFILGRERSALHQQGSLITSRGPPPQIPQIPEKIKQWGEDCMGGKAASYAQSCWKKLHYQQKLCEVFWTVYGCSWVNAIVHSSKAEEDKLVWSPMHRLLCQLSCAPRQQGDLSIRHSLVY